MRLWFAAPLAVLAVQATGCSGRSDNDPFSKPAPSAAGQGPHIADVSDPSKKTHAASNAMVTVTGVVVTAVDEYDETQDGKSRGTIYVQDLESHAPFAATSLFSPTFVPASLVVGPGDVLDLNGQYQENATLGTTVTFPAGEVLPQISHPTGTFRFEYKAPDPTPIDWHDLQQYATGRKWIGQLVVVTDLTLTAAVVTSDGRQSGVFGTGENPAITNELTPINAYPKGQKLKSVTGLVTYFYNLHIAPRSSADIVAE